MVFQMGDGKVLLKLKEIFLSDSSKIDDVVRDRVLMVKNQHEHTVSIAEMKMLCWMCGKTR
jgi:hypothetical protein